MGNIARRPNGTYRARYRDHNGKEHSRHFRRKVDAQQWLAHVTSTIVTGTYVDPRVAKMTVREWANKWLEGYATRRPSTIRQARVHIGQINAAFGDQRLATIRPSDVNAWTASMKHAGLSDSYVYATYRRLAQLMGDAVHDGILVRSPCSRKTAPGNGQQRPYVATSEQVWALHDAVPFHVRTAVLLGAFAGLRTSEAAGLRKRDVDTDPGMIRPEVQWGGKPLKSAAARTPVPVPSELACLLVDGEAATVVTNEVGEPFAPWSIERAIRAVRASVPGLPGEFRFHDLRHFYASLLISSGLDVKVVQARMRHASAMTTLNTYGHLFPDADESARAAVWGVVAARADYLRTERDAQPADLR